MKRTKKITTLNVAATIEIDELFLEEAEAYALIKSVDVSQASVEFTEKIIIDLIKELKKEFPDDYQEWNDFTQSIVKALEMK